MQYAATLARVFEGYIRPCAGGSLLDVGGSTGVVAIELAEKPKSPPPARGWTRSWARSVQRWNGASRAAAARVA
jgi:hypothetical protein